MMKYNFNLRPLEKGQSPKNPQLIYLVSYFKTNGVNKKFQYSTGFKVVGSHWNTTTQRVKNVLAATNSQAVNNFLNDLSTALNKWSDEMKANRVTVTAQKLRDFMDEYTGKNQVESLTFFDFINDFIENSHLRLNPNNREKLITPVTIQKYRTTLAHIQDFAKSKRRKSFDFLDIDMNFYDGFTSYLTNVKGFKPNTIGKYISAIKTFLKHAETKGYEVCKAYQSDSFKRQKVDVDHVYLNETELMKLKNFDLSDNPRLDKVRDLFLLGAYTGLRFSDYREITPEKIVKNEKGDFNIRLNQRKTGGLVVVPCTNLALEILNKYQMKLPKSPSNQNTNEYLKELCQMVGFDQITAFTEVKGGKTYDVILPKWQRISTHTARRSFATNAYKRGIQTKAIMQITGHKNEMSFYKYIVVGKEENADLMREKLNEPKPMLVKVA